MKSIKYLLPLLMASITCAAPMTGVSPPNEWGTIVCYILFFVNSKAFALILGDHEERNASFMWFISAFTHIFFIITISFSYGVNVAGTLLIIEWGYFRYYNYKFNKRIKAIEKKTMIPKKDNVVINFSKELTQVKYKS